MKSKKNWTVALGALALAAALLVGITYARYREELVGDQAFQVKPAQQLSFASQQWQEDEDGNWTLTFSLEQSVENCRAYLAVSEGITQPETLQITLTLPGEQTGELTREPVTLTATGQAITPGSSLYSVFGAGFVFRFYGAEEQAGEEMTLDLEKDESYTLTVSGLSAAAEQTSLLRLFVDYTK